MSMNSLRLRKRRKLSGDCRAELIPFGDKCLVRFGPLLHLFVTKNNVIYHKGSVKHNLFQNTSLATLVKLLRKNLFIENSWYCVGYRCLAQISRSKSKVVTNKLDRLDGPSSQLGFTMSSGIVKINRHIDRFDPYLQHLISATKSPIVIIDSKGCVHYSKKSLGFVIIDYFPYRCDTIVIDLKPNSDEVIVKTIQECDPLKNSIKLGEGKGHLLMCSNSSSNSAQFQVLFIGKGGYEPNNGASAEQRHDIMRPIFHCTLDQYCLTQFGGKVYLLSNRETDSKPIALIKLSIDLQAISILHLKELVEENCYLMNKQIFIGKKPKRCTREAKSRIRKVQSNAVISFGYQSFLLSIYDLCKTLLKVSDIEMKPNRICFGEISRTSNVVDISADGKIRNFQFGRQKNLLQKLIECSNSGSDMKRPRMQLYAQMMATDLLGDKTRYPFSSDLSKHTIWLDSNATLYIRGYTNIGLQTSVKLQKKGFAFVYGYLIVLCVDGGTVCHPRETKLIKIKDGQHFLLCGKNGHILFVGKNNFQVFNPNRKSQEDPIERYFRVNANRVDEL